MTEGHAVVQHQEAVCRVDRGELDPEAQAGALQEQRIADRLRRRDEQQRRASPGRASTRRT